MGEPFFTAASFESTWLIDVRGLSCARALAILAIVFAGPYAHAQIADPDEPRQPASTVGAGSSPADAAKTSSADADHERAHRAVTTWAIGPTQFSVVPTNDVAEPIHHPGVVLDFSVNQRLSSNAGFGLRLAWGLTEFRRFKSFTSVGYDIGSWTTTAYRDVWSWAGDREKHGGWGVVPAIFGSVGLLVPYMVAGVIYLVAVVAPSTYLEIDALGTYEFGQDGTRGVVPYLKGGLGFVGYLHPEHNQLLGGVGPSVGFGVRFGKVDLAVKGTWLPPWLHGEFPGEHSHILMGGLTIGYAN